MADTFAQAYQQARNEMDRLRNSARRAGATSVMHEIMAGRPVVVTKGFKSGGEILSRGAEVTLDPTLVNRWEVLAGQGYFTTPAQYKVSLEWEANKSKVSALEEVYKKWDSARMEKLKAERLLSSLEAEIARVKGDLKSTTERLEKVEAEGMEVFSRIKKN